jgi:hypothetical protein
MALNHGKSREKWMWEAAEENGRAIDYRFECAVGGVRHPQHTQTGSRWYDHFLPQLLKSIFS